VGRCEVALRVCREGVALGLWLSFALGACTFSGAPSPPAPEPSVTSSPPESSAEKKQRLAFEGAEAAYRRNMDEQGRLYAAGGALESTKVLRDTSTGDYLDFIVGDLRYMNRKGFHASAPTVILGVAPIGLSDDSVTLKACEDNSKSLILDRSGNDRTPKTSRQYVQTLNVVMVGGRWKVAHGRTQKVQNFRSQDCGST
jgi:hypothetical protein